MRGAVLGGLADLDCLRVLAYGREDIPVRRLGRVDGGNGLGRGGRRVRQRRGIIGRYERRAYIRRTDKSNGRYLLDRLPWSSLSFSNRTFGGALRTSWMRVT